MAPDLAADANVEASAERLNQRLGPVRQTIPSPQEIGRFFDGLELTPPGLVQLPRWRPTWKIPARSRASPCPLTAV